MNATVALVQSYLRVNGYFTVEEYPILEAVEPGGHQMATDLPAGHRARIVAFGTSGGDDQARSHTVVELGHVIGFLRSHLRDHWDILRHAQVKDPGLSFLMLLEKAEGDSA